MSLLMDALKKAEEAKRQSEAAARVGPQESALPAGATAGAPAREDKKGLPELPSRLELLDDELRTAAPVAEPAAAKPKLQAGAQEKDRASAQNLFDAKHPGSRRAFPIAVGTLSLAAAAGIGGYLWWQMQPKGSLAVAPSAKVAPRAPMSETAVPSTQPTTPVVPQSAIPGTASPPPASSGQTVPKPAAERKLPLGTRDGAPEASSPIRITTGQPKINPAAIRAYQELAAGNMANARRDYEQVLQSEPRNADALHGLAAIDLREGRFDAAEEHFLRALEADPKDAAALAGLIALKGQVDPVQSESRLKSLLAAQPESPALNFTLGNVYARQGRWNEAQQAYFRAYSGDSENPDYAFNLAVSLDQLRQPRLALQYYQAALAAAQSSPAAFDKNVVAGRVRDLRQ